MLEVGFIQDEGARIAVQDTEHRAWSSSAGGEDRPVRDAPNDLKKTAFAGAEVTSCPQVGHHWQHIEYPSHQHVQRSQGLIPLRKLQVTMDKVFHLLK